MTTRITGLYSGLDIDALVEAGASYYQNKVNKAKQTEQKLEWEQDAYRTVQSSVQDFYDKYLGTSGENSLLLSSNWNTNSYVSSDSSKVSVSSTSDADIDNYTVSVTSMATAANLEITDSDLTSISKIDINGTEYTLTGSTAKEKASSLSSQLSSSAGVSAKYSSFANGGSGGLVISSTTLGSSSTFTCKLGGSSGTAQTITAGTDCKATITNSSGESINYTGSSNTATYDGVTFNFLGKTSSDVSVTGTKDVSDVQDKIESFMDDYNTLIKSINTKIYETHNSSYEPLTDSEKESMTETQITKWETKAKTGLLRHDSYLEKLASDMKSAMSTFVKSAGINIEDIGISAVSDYTTKNGTYSVDSTKLKSALEGGITKTDSSSGTKKTITITFDNIKSMFMNGYSSITSLSTKNADGDGLLSKLKVAFNNNATMSSSALAKRAGIEGTTSESTNEITKLLKEQDTLIDDLEDKLSDREDALYAKYSKLETSLSSLESSSSIFSSSS